MSTTARASYGIDRPDVLAAVAVAVAVLLSLGLLRLLPVTSVYLGLALALTEVLFVVGQLRKPAVARKLLDQVPWRGDEKVLDVGCGRGPWLIAAAKHLATGRAVGVDLWDSSLQSGNKPESTLRNAALEGVSERVEVRDGDARFLPFDDGTFDIVVTSLVLHHVARFERRNAVKEMVRVLKPGGSIVMHELFPELAWYSGYLRELGVTEIEFLADGVSGLFGFRTLMATKGQ